MLTETLWRGYTARLLLLMLVVALLLGVLLLRLWHLQLRDGDAHRTAITRQSVRSIRLPPIRGRILSRDGACFTDNAPTYDVYFHLHEMRQAGRRGLFLTSDYVLGQIGRAGGLVGREGVLTKDDLRRHIRLYPALPVLAFHDLDDAGYARLQECIPPIPGMEITTSARRLYPQGEAGAQLIGFVGRRDPSTEADRTNYSYFLPEQWGRSGLEALYDGRLKGSGGASLVRVDSTGFYQEELEHQDAIAGDDLILNLDSRAERIAQNLLRGQRGALVLLDCQNGAVLAMVSSPSYDLGTLDATTYAALQRDEVNKPLLNRALSPGFLPGSIVKPLVACAALDGGLVDPAQVVNCPGYYLLGNTKIHCNARNGHGDVDLLGALEQSCNTYFITIGMKTGVDRLHDVFQSAGIGQDTHCDLALHSNFGLLPGREELARRPGHRDWQASDTAFVSIGQGAITLSPLQAAMYAAALANGGTLYRPLLLRATRDPQGRVSESPAQVLGHLQASPSALATVREGMHRVVHGANATAPAARTSVIDLAGKTGTAEIGTKSNRRKNTWFICYGPFANPRYACAVLVENGISGGKSAAPIARRFFELWLAKGGPVLDVAPPVQVEPPPLATPDTTEPPDDPEDVDGNLD